MLYRAGLPFSNGLKKSIMIKKSTMEFLDRHKAELIKEFGGIDVRSQDWLIHFPDEDHWSNPDAGNNKLCSMARHHNYFVRYMYDAMRDDREAKNVELVKLTSKKASTYWPMFLEVTIPPERWSAEYYKEEMNELMLVLQGKGDDYVMFTAPPLTLKQAAEVVIAFDLYLDRHDIRLTLPHGCDELYPSDECIYCVEKGEDFLDNDMDDFECRKCSNTDCDYGNWIKEEYADREEAVCVHCNEVYEKRYMVKLDESLDPPGEERYACQECFGIESQDGTPDLDGDGNEIIDEEEEEDAE